MKKIYNYISRLFKTKSKKKDDEKIIPYQPRYVFVGLKVHFINTIYKVTNIRDNSQRLTLKPVSKYIPKKGLPKDYPGKARKGIRIYILDYVYEITKVRKSDRKISLKRIGKHTKNG